MYGNLAREVDRALKEMEERIYKVVNDKENATNNRLSEMRLHSSSASFLKER